VKKTYLMALIACLFALCFALAGCGNDGASQEASSTNEPAAESQAATQEADDQAASETGLSAADFANPDIVIENGAFASMAELPANIQNARSEGTVLQVDGDVVSYGMSYSIVEANADGTKRIGTVFVIEGASEADYPKDGQRAKITGIVGSDETGYTYHIKTLPEFVEVVG